MLALAWQYLTGRAVATDPADRSRAEWPPHPDRVFQALVAAWGESGGGDQGAEALRWLCNLPAPGLVAPADAEEEEPDATDVATRLAAPTTYVPVNDIDGPQRGAYADKHLRLLPAERTRKERCFPAVFLGSAPCALVWPSAEPNPDVRASLASLCSAVTHLGHSSSLVRMWLEEEPLDVTYEPVADGARRDLGLRVSDPGRFETLVSAYAGGGSAWRRPPMALWHGYRRVAAADDALGGSFDARLMVLRRIGGDVLSLPQTLALTTALRGALLSHAEGPALEQISGHSADGSKTRELHVAYLPLPFAGHPHADGRLLGMALALPRNTPYEAEDAVIRALAASLNEQGVLRLVCGPVGSMELVAEDRPAAPVALRARTWCAPARCWGTVTPIVLDRQPPRRHADHDGWAAEEIASSCERQGLPAPLGVRILGGSPHQGVPPARAFPPIPRKDGGRRWHVHAALEFPLAVAGPLVLGAGRYRGYGFLRALPRTEAQA